MSLTAQFASHFDSAIQHRGANYFDGDSDEDDDDSGDYTDSERREETQRVLRPIPERAPQPAPAVAPRKPAPRPPGKSKAPNWRKQIAELFSKPSSADAPSSEPWPPTRELLYVINVAGAGADGTLYPDVLCRDLKMDGGWSKPKPRHLQREWQQ
jgi:hypothetical protein